MSLINDDWRSQFRRRCIRFAGQILAFASRLPKNQATRNIIDQILKSGTSVGANVHEARGAESLADFAHKLQIALKEALETGYWLAVINESKLTQDPLLPALLLETDEISKILAKSVITTKRNAQVVS
jgi:four helix bundle protein